MEDFKKSELFNSVLSAFLLSYIKYLRNEQGTMSICYNAQWDMAKEVLKYIYNKDYESVFTEDYAIIVNIADDTDIFYKLLRRDVYGV